MKRKSRLTKLSFYNKKTSLAGNRRAMDFVYLNTGKAFDTVSHNTPTYKLWKYNLDKCGLKTGQIAGIIGFWITGQSPTSSQSADNRKSGGVVDMQDGYATIQRGLNRLKKWDNSNVITFNKGKCKVPHLGRNNLTLLYTLSANWLESSFAEKDCFMQKGGSRQPAEVPSNFNHSVILSVYILK